MMHIFLSVQPFSESSKFLSRRLRCFPSPFPYTLTHRWPIPPPGRVYLVTYGLKKFLTLELAAPFSFFFGLAPSLRY